MSRFRRVRGLCRAGIAAALVFNVRLHPHSQVLVFCDSRKRCETLATRVAAMLKRRGGPRLRSIRHFTLATLMPQVLYADSAASGRRYYTERWCVLPLAVARRRVLHFTTRACVGLIRKRSNVLFARGECPSSWQLRLWQRVRWCRGQCTAHLSRVIDCSRVSVSILRQV